MVRRKKGDCVNGWVILDKPFGLTSVQAISSVRRFLCAQKVGHAGTLDPLATGVLPVALGEATKTISFVVDGVKVYRFKIRWGEETATGDAEGQVVMRWPKRPSEDEIRAIFPRFTGVISQVPPSFSAIKINGVRAYTLARRGEEVVCASRFVHIHRLDLLYLDDADHATFEIECGKGTYVRSLARDMGRALDCGGHVFALHRVRVGPFYEDSMIPLEKLKQLSHSSDEFSLNRAQVLLPVVASLNNLPAVSVSRHEAVRLRNGCSVFLQGNDLLGEKQTVYATHEGILVALGSVECGSLNPLRVFKLSFPMEQGLN